MLSCPPKSAACVMSSPTAVTAFSYLPMGFPLRKKWPACLIPSNSRKTFWPSAEAGSLKCFRYQPMPSIFSLWSPPLWLMYALYVSVSFQVCGRLTLAQAESSKAGCSAPAASPKANFHPGLKLYVARGEAGAANFAPTDKPPASAFAAGWSAVEQAPEKRSSAPSADETRGVFMGEGVPLWEFWGSSWEGCRVRPRRADLQAGRPRQELVARYLRGDEKQPAKAAQGVSRREQPRRTSSPRAPGSP